MSVNGRRADDWSRRSRWLAWIAATAILSASAPPVLRAQTATASVTGSVSDDTGATVPDARITLESLGTGQQREARTPRTGRFTFPALPPGRYRLTAIGDGFTPVAVPDFTLNVGDELVVPIQFTVAGIGETVTVRQEASLLTTRDGSVSTVIDRATIERMPLSGGTLHSLIDLAPASRTSRRPRGRGPSP